LQPRKVWKHFYNGQEQWWCICDQDPRQLRKEVEALVGRSRDTSCDLPRLDHELWKRVRDLTWLHHDEAYGATYLAEIRSGETLWTRGMDPRFRQHALTPRSVYLIVQLAEPSWVITAFRPHPPSKDVPWSEETFRRHGLRKLAKEDSMHSTDISRLLAEELRRTASEKPKSVEQLWHLALAVGHGRLLTHQPEIAALLPAAEATLGSVDPQLVTGLRSALDWDGVVLRIASGLKDDGPEDLEEALSDAEDLLTVAAPLGEAAAASALLEQARELLPWIPADWDHLQARAARGIEAYGGMVAQLWEAVAEAVTGALLRQGAPESPPAHRLVEQIMLDVAGHQDAPAIKRINERASAVMSRIQDAVQEIQGAALSWMEGLWAANPAPAMGAGTSDAPRPWEIRCSHEAGATSQRVFVVDEEYPEGYEVTDEARAGDASLWSLESPGHTVLVVLFVSKDPVKGEHLEDALNFAEQRDSVAVLTHLVSRPR